MTSDDSQTPTLPDWLSGRGGAADEDDVISVAMASRVGQLRSANHVRYEAVPDDAETAILIVVATVGIVGNCGIILAVLLVPKLRQPCNAFLFHQCLLDLLKSTYCLPLAHSMVGSDAPSFCGLIGGSYILFVTSSSFNLLAMVMNESYQLNDLLINVGESRNYCCVVFGIFIIWFSSIVMNLGVAFIPGNPSYDGELGLCIFIYGITRNYVLHLLWILLITMALCCTCTYLWKLHRDIRKISYYRLTTLVRATVSIDPKVTTTRLRERSERIQKRRIKSLQHVATKKLFLLVLLTTMFVVFWYPLFVLTLIDPTLAVSYTMYKALTVFAFSNPTITPVVLIFFIHTACCCCGEQTPPADCGPLEEPAVVNPEVADAVANRDPTATTSLWIDHVDDDVRAPVPDADRRGGSLKKPKKNVTWQHPV